MKINKKTNKNNLTQVRWYDSMTQLSITKIIVQLCFSPGEVYVSYGFFLIFGKKEEVNYNE